MVTGQRRNGGPAEPCNSQQWALGLLFSTWGSINHCSQEGKVCISMTIHGVGLFCFLGEKNDLLLMLLVCAARGMLSAQEPARFCPSFICIFLISSSCWTQPAGSEAELWASSCGGWNEWDQAVRVCVVQRRAPSGGLVQGCTSRKQGNTSKSAQGVLFTQQHWT